MVQERNVWREITLTAKPIPFLTIVVEWVDIPQIEAIKQLLLTREDEADTPAIVEDRPRA